MGRRIRYSDVRNKVLDIMLLSGMTISLIGSLFMIAYSILLLQIHSIIPYLLYISIIVLSIFGFRIYIQETK
ncbi:MAG: hypothetical protein ACTSVU_00055 [Promethearchaeota archaeon]